MPSYMRPTYSHSSSLKNPCPPGTSIGYGYFNGTIFLICEVWSSEGTESDALALGLGLGLGLGIPFLCILCACIWCSGIQLPWLRNLPAVRPTTLTFATPDAVLVKEGLSIQALDDLIFDILSDTLKRELMILRVKKGRNLDEFACYARSKKALTVAIWIDQMNPGSFPREVFRSAESTTGEAKEVV